MPRLLLLDDHITKSAPSNGRVNTVGFHYSRLLTRMVADLPLKFLSRIAILTGAKRASRSFKSFWSFSMSGSESGLTSRFLTRVEMSQSSRFTFLKGHFRLFEAILHCALNFEDLMRRSRDALI